MGLIEAIMDIPAEQQSKCVLDSLMLMQRK